ncbi:MAG: carbohydrate binding family 9 domain-containing protein [Acidobacteria bacterium]|nr:carbohydrate binding family 9 domain-containing protein [Acidobacteriota bacterium]
MSLSFRRYVPASIIASVVSLIPVVAHANAELTQADAVPQLRAVRIPDAGTPPTLDGRVTEEIWSTVAPHSTFTQTDPIEGAPASERTEVRVLFDKTTLYIGVICFDSEPSKIVVSQNRRDADLSETDAIILVLDTFNDHQNAFVFGTNAIGILYDGQVAAEGLTSGISSNVSGGGGSQRGTISSFNPNWDGDWRVKASITERGWEAELAIPFKTLRYATGSDKVWGFNVKRNIRRKNEQVYLAPVQRGFDIYRISSAAKLTGLDLQPRHDLKVTPYVLGSVNKDYTVATNQVASRWNPFGGDRNVGLDVKWGVRPNLTADFTVNTDFAQVEADEEQVNLTRFDLFFPEKRPFFLENASVFQFGAPQQVDLFFSRRIGLSATGSSGLPIDIDGGGRLSGKIGSYNVGLLTMQTESATDATTGKLITEANNFGVVRVQREVGRSNFGVIFVNRQGTGAYAGANDYNRAYGVDANLQVSRNAKLFLYAAGTTSPTEKGGSDHSERVFYNFANNVWQVTGGYSRVGDNFNPEVGYLPRRGYWRPEWRVFFQPQPKRWPWIRRISPHTSYNAYVGLDDNQVQSSMAHFHFFEIDPAQGGRFGTFVDRNSDRPVAPFTVFNAGGQKVVIPPGDYTWYQISNEYLSDPSAVISTTLRWRHGGFYDGDFDAYETQLNWRAGQRFLGSAGWTRQNIDLRYGAFHTDLVPMKVSYAFTTLANLQALVQYNNQSSLLTTNIRLALLNRSGTGVFVVYNDRRDTYDRDPYTTLGRSFIVKYTRLVDF